MLQYHEGLVIDAWREAATSDAIETTSTRLCDFATEQGMRFSRVGMMREALRATVARSLATMPECEASFSVAAASDGEWLTIMFDAPSPPDYLDDAPFVFASLATRVEVGVSRDNVSYTVMEVALQT